MILTGGFGIGDACDPNDDNDGVSDDKEAANVAVVSGETVTLTATTLLSGDLNDDTINIGDATRRSLPANWLPAR